MTRHTTAVLSALVLSAGLWTAATPASALGGCGRNFHRAPGGFCVFGGQNQAWCLRHKGHVAGHGPGNTRWCG